MPFTPLQEQNKTIAPLSGFKPLSSVEVIPSVEMPKESGIVSVPKRRERFFLNQCLSFPPKFAKPRKTPGFHTSLKRKRCRRLHCSHQNNTSSADREKP